MQWSDEAIVLALRRHGEGSAVAELFTREHGRHLGLIRGARRESAALQAGNSVAATWRGRLSEHLGFWRIEPQRIRAGALLDNAIALAALRAATALSAAVLPEREPHAALYAALLDLLDSLGAPARFPALFVRYELKLLEDLGFGLDLAAAARAGAVPAFLLEPGRAAPSTEIAQGLALTGDLIERHLLFPQGRALPPARRELATRLARGP